jgi:Protein of unknown function (DUF3043)
LRSVFRRRTTNEAAPEESPGSPDAKGRRTPKRREAQELRKQRMTAPRTRKQASALQRDKRRAERMKTQMAMVSGDEAALPVRDKGPVRRFCRDYVDSRRNFVSYLLPCLVVILLVGVVPPAAGLVVLLWMVTIIFTLLDSVYLMWKLGRELASRFPDENTSGARLYALLRASQIRRLRLPKPQVELGAELPTRY